MTMFEFDIKKASVIILLLGAFFAFDVSAKDKEDRNLEKEKVEAEPEKRKCEKNRLVKSI